MARKKKRKSSWLRILLLLLFVPLAVWSGAFVIWIYWYDINSWLSSGQARRVQPSAMRERGARRETAPAKRPQERILDDDRKRLEEILKRRN